MDHASIDLFQLVGFFADEFDAIDLDVSPLQQAACIPAAHVPLSVRTLSLCMKRVLGDNFPECFNPCSLSTRVVLQCRDLEQLACVLIDPFLSGPFCRIDIVCSDKVKACRIDTNRMSERSHMAAQKEIERLDLPRVASTCIETFERPQDRRTADRNAADRRCLLKR